VEAMIVKKHVECDTCNEVIDDEFFYRKNHLGEEQFCSRSCLEKNAIENLEIRTETVNDLLERKQSS
jgi:hypothetical protein